MADKQPSPIRILIVDDHPLLREGLAAILDGSPDILVVGEASNGAEAIEKFQTVHPDVVLMDLQMPVMNGIEATQKLRAEWTDARIIILTTYSGDAQAIQALKAGATGYLLKSSLRTEMVRAIKDVQRGQRYVQSEVASEIAHHVMSESLTAREVDVLRLVAVGQSNKTIARSMSLSEETIKAHLKSIFTKLEVADRTHAVTVAIKRGIIWI